jgi:transcription elongation GreA/GreB family factor
MREEFEKLAAAGKLGFKHIESLVALTQSGFCLHKHWGFGRLVSVDTVFARFTIDFQNKPGHTMDLAFAAESLQPIAKDHILARKASNLEELRQMAALHHLDLIKLVLQSLGGRATLDQIQQMLVPDVIASDWKKWWEVAKREIKKDGHYQLPAKKTEPIVFQEQVMSLQDRLMAELRAAKGLKARTLVAGEVLRSLPDLQDKQAVATESIAALNAEIVTYLRTQPAVALDAIFARDDLRLGAGLPPAQGEIQEKDIWAQELQFGPMMEQMAAPKHRRALQSFRQACPDTWAATVQKGLNTVSAKLCAELVHLLVSEGRLDLLKETLGRHINQHSASSELLLWLARERSDTFADILGPEVFRAMLTAMERDQFNEKRANRLGDYVLNDQSLLPELIEAADSEVIKDLTRALQFSPCFPDMDKRSLLGRIVKIYPSMQSLISGEQATRQDAALLVSWESLERRKQEYDELVHKKIPANSKEIAVARSYGDLSENFEYKAAKDMQKILSRRKHELEQELARARGTDFSNPRTDVASTGTRVVVRDLDSQQSETFAILGAFDGDAEQGIISYLTPVAQAVLNRPVGQEVQIDLHGAIKRYRIEAIEAYRQAQVAAPPPPEPPDTPVIPPATESAPPSPTPPTPDAAGTPPV